MVNPNVLGRSSEDSGQEAQKQGVQKRAEIRVHGMTCANCTGAVENALRAIEGVSEVEVSLLREKATVHFDGAKTSSDQLVSEVEDVGFDASLMLVRDTSGENNGEEDRQDFHYSRRRRVELSVQGMTGSACTQNVERALKGLSGTLEVQVSLMRGKVVMVCDPSVSGKMAVQEVESVGYEAKLIAQTEVDNRPVPKPIKNIPPEIAKLHLASANEKVVKDAVEMLNDMNGVVNTTASKHIVEITYRPSIVGSRKLLKTTGMEHTETHFEDAKPSATIIFDLTCAVPPTLVVLFIVFVMPMTEMKGLLHFTCGIPGLHGETLVLFALATHVQCIVGRRFHVAARKALRRRSPNMDVLISTATCMAYAYSSVMIVYAVYLASCGETSGEEPPPHFFETPCTLITVVMIGRLIESLAKRRTTESLDKLIQSPPSRSWVVSSICPVSLPTELVELMDVIEIRPGEVAPVDGTLLPWSGIETDIPHEDDPYSAADATFDESLLTGESKPVPKIAGSQIIGGSRLMTSEAVRIRAERIGSGTALAQIISLVDRAAASAAASPAQRMADRMAHVFVPSVIFLAVVTACVWLYLLSFGKVTMPETVHNHGRAFDKSEQVMFALKFGLSVLLVACPCALGLATPCAVMVSTGVAAQRGILVKAASALELSNKRGSVVLDKTGTLTQGHPGVVAVAACWQPSDCEAVAAVERLGSDLIQGLGADMKPLRAVGNIDVIQLARDGVPVPEKRDLPKDLVYGICVILAAASSRGEHPLSRGLEDGACDLAGCKDQPHRLLAHSPKVDCFKSEAGCGVSFKLGDVNIEVGSMEWVDKNHPSSVWAQAERHNASTIVAVKADDVLIGLAALRDSLHPSARAIVQELERGGEEVWMCTGDHTITAAAVAKELSISPERVKAEALPAHKAALVTELQQKGHRVLFVGDGMNDAPALTSADVGIAIGAGARITVDAADVVLVRSELSDLIVMRELAEATVNCIRRNFAWACVFNLVMLPVAAGVFYDQGIHLAPAAAAAAMASSSITVVSSSLCLKRFRPQAVRDEGAMFGNFAEYALRSRSRPKGHNAQEIQPLNAAYA
mmetsp:Transcript_81315/g.143466  ORF Transcript_81315/g.143466 Transcript_81315/m.143466 type:complete len:1083 (-) Transcript_81315:150-3398(-)|eukprot:CAMPEP_0197625524 /NCGR_PEP_ID=MMETSP1338-20131121/4868_1 /TAXON_ID=43686 ORGANISM="Pelagodinium beii, Strain RCC1491" /NCGR_SAMPLE_ID=MMETSP1338 /ASSEMBLY_ACC=CAM_ASM_000754 /LENGTH=1082 /DNA_ID=CAMNT_0043195955 /DNA_START=108 /DNA_END=3356 /DNA_ORIENTATION=+